MEERERAEGRSVGVLTRVLKSDFIIIVDGRFGVCPETLSSTSQTIVGL